MPGPGEPVSEAAVQDATRRIRALLEQVPDPEIPVVNVVDLGIVREVRAGEDAPEVVITPTYSGCPATRMIEHEIRRTLDDNGFEHARIIVSLYPPWTTDWITDTAREKLRDFGIAPPAEGTESKRELMGEQPEVACPRCRSTRTERISEFGSTPCKAHYRCLACLEPFDYFKCL